MSAAAPPTTWWLSADDVLRGRPWLVEPTGPRRFALIGMLIVFGCAYGSVMGAYALNPQQMLYSAIKAPLLVGASFAISLPSFFVVSTLLGLREHFRSSIRALMAAQAGFAVILASFSPLTAFVYVSGIEYGNAINWNGVMFLTASLAAQSILRRLYAPLIEEDPRHRIALICWLLIYCFIAIQMAWTLRPFVGAPDLEPTFFRGTDLGNAYVTVARRVWGLIVGH